MRHRLLPALLPHLGGLHPELDRSHLRRSEIRHSREHARTDPGELRRRVRGSKARYIRETREVWKLGRRSKRFCLFFPNAHDLIDGLKLYTICVLHLLAAEFDKISWPAKRLGGLRHLVEHGVAVFLADFGKLRAPVRHRIEGLYDGFTAVFASLGEGWIGIERLIRHIVLSRRSMHWSWSFVAHGRQTGQP